VQEWDGALGPQEEKVIDRLGFLLNACESLDCTKVDPAVMLVDFSEVFVCSWQTDTVQAWWWELVEMFRKLILTVALAALYKGEPPQVAHVVC
jgi:hypothetical protein